MEFTIDRIKEIAELRIKKLQEAEDTITAQNTEHGFKEFKVNGAKLYTVLLADNEIKRTKNFRIAYNCYHKL